MCILKWSVLKVDIYFIIVFFCLSALFARCMCMLELKCVEIRNNKLYCDGSKMWLISTYVVPLVHSRHRTERNRLVEHPSSLAGSEFLAKATYLISVLVEIETLRISCHCYTKGLIFHRQAQWFQLRQPPALSR